MTTVMPTARVLAGFANDPTSRTFILDVSLLDGGDLLAGPDDGFADVTTRLDGDAEHSIHITSCGRTTPLQDYTGATVELTFLNLDGALDPLYEEGPYTVDGVTLVECGRRFWILLVMPDGTIEDRFQGQAEAYRPDLSDPAHPKMVVECAGLFALVARVNPDASAPVGEGEDSGSRIHRLLDIPGIPDGDRNIAVGDATLQPTTLAQNTLGECRLVSSSESPLRSFYENRHGQLQFDNRRAPFTVERMRTPRATFGPETITDDGVLPYVSLSPVLDKEQLVNVVSNARTGGIAQDGEDEESKAKFFPYTDKRTDLLLETDLDAAWRTEWDLLLHSRPRYRYQSLTLDVHACRDELLEEMVAFMATSALRDRLAVLEQVAYPGDPHDPEAIPFVREALEEQFVERVDEWIALGDDCVISDWRQEIAMSSAAAFTGIFQLDVSLLDGVDVLAPF